MRSRSSTFHPDPHLHQQGWEAEYTKWVFDLELPAPADVSWTIGHLIVWSNDLLVDLAGSGFEHMEHLSEFLVWAKDR